MAKTSKKKQFNNGTSDRSFELITSNDDNAAEETLGGMIKRVESDMLAPIPATTGIGRAIPPSGLVIRRPEEIQQILDRSLDITAKVQVLAEESIDVVVQAIKAKDKDSNIDEHTITNRFGDTVPDPAFMIKLNTSQFALRLITPAVKPIQDSKDTGNKKKFTIADVVRQTRIGKGDITTERTRTVTVTQENEENEENDE